MQMENIICDCHQWASYVPVVARTNIDFPSNDANSWKKDKLHIQLTNNLYPYLTGI